MRCMGSEKSTILLLRARRGTSLFFFAPYGYIEDRFLALLGMTIDSQVTQPLLAVCILRNSHRQECLCYFDSPDPHAIAVTVKAVAGFDRVLVCPQNEFAAGKRADEDEQRGLWQMKIRQKLIDHAERVARLHENGRFRWAGLDKRIRGVRFSPCRDGGFFRCVFKRAHHRCSHSQDGPAFAARAANGSCRRHRKFRSARNEFCAARSPLRGSAEKCRGRRPA